MAYTYRLIAVLRSEYYFNCSEPVSRSYKVTLDYKLDNTVRINTIAHKLFKKVVSKEFPELNYSKEYEMYVFEEPCEQIVL